MKKDDLNEKFYIALVGLVDRDNLISEIYFQGIQWAEISQETEEVRIQFYPHPYQEYWEFEVDEAILAIKLAKAKLLGESLEDVSV